MTMDGGCRRTSMPSEVSGGILLSANAYEEAAASGLTASDFSLDSNRRIYSRMVELAESSRPIDTITLIEELERHRNWEQLATLAPSPVSSMASRTAEHQALCKNRARKANLRKLIHACNATVVASSNGSSSRECIAELSEQILQIQTGSDDAPAERVVEFSDQVYTDWQRLADSDAELIGLLPASKRWTGNYRYSTRELWLVAGRTGDGKTALALQITAANCRSGIPTGFFSIEMSKDDLLQRLWSHEVASCFRASATQEVSRLRRALALSRQ